MLFWGVKNFMSFNKFSIILSLTFAMTSCAGPESYQEKMARYTPKKTLGKNLVPEYKISDANYHEPSKGRFPASSPDSPHKTDDSKEVIPTNKKLYFLNLIDQYESLKSFSKDYSGTSISICPSFHTTLVRHNEENQNHSNTLAIKKFSYDSTKIMDEKYLAKRPELYLPLSSQEVTPKVIDIAKNTPNGTTEASLNELVQKALDIHLSKTYSEIRELCEYGVSDNYFVYENLITYVKNNKFRANSSNMQILLKTTLFSNFALLTSLDTHVVKSTSGRKIASVKTELNLPYSKELIERLNVAWTNQYFDSLKMSN